MVTTAAKISVEKLGDALGAEVRGIDLSRPVPDDVFRRISDAWLEHLVLVFPDQALTNEQHIAFSRRFGTLEVHPSRKHNVKDYPELLLLTNRKDAAGNYVSLRDGGTIWHSDLSYMAEPSRCSLLYAIDVPVDGGDTEWANMYRAYEALPQRLRERIAGLRAVHQFDLVDNPRFGPPAHMNAEDLKGSIWEPKSAVVKARTPDAIHPVARIHPVTGRPALFVSRRFTTRVVGMAPDEGESLLLDLFDYAERPEHIYHHRWSKNQLLLWDNRCTVHLACGGVPDSQIRTMQRTTVRGEAPV
jgi:taurine dioxygenase